MIKRTVFGAIYVAVIVAGIMCGPLAFLLLMLLLVSLAVNEFLVMTHPVGSSPAEATVGMLLRSLDCVGAAIMAVTAWTGILFLPGLVTYLLYLMMRLTIQLWIHNDNAISSLSASLMSQLYIAVPVALMSVVYRISPHLLLLLFILVWVNDTFAYLTGVTMGRHKLWERISPKKTWEGFWGGTVATMAVSCMCGLIWGRWFGGISPLAMTLLGLAVACAATLGDLVESLLKRTAGVKDSGTLIPGHGGILDRIDSILLVIPASLVFIFFLTYYAF